MSHRSTLENNSARIGSAFQALSLCYAVVGGLLMIDMPARAAGHHHPTNNHYLIPPPPPTPVLCPAPPPVELPYSYAYTNFQPSVAKAMKQYAPKQVPATVHSACPNMSPSLAKANGFGTPRAGITIGAGGAFAMPFFSNAKTGNSWFDSCLNWYTGHNQQISSGQIPANNYWTNFNPVYPKSLEQQAYVAPPAVPIATTSYAVEEPREFTQPAPHHTDFRHRKHVTARR